ncbi:KEOPS complex subunit Pcc1 [Haladaptatus sp. DYSN1]|uniref:KEOPS complex subunit Pcc1 n=1 Tax=unclassified Haladaptatus TaxID=2622732 RepID=UPI00240668CD|nr:KEOPS complex subunit Pcc1 [Haladaptatus sp. DYSN1]
MKRATIRTTHEHAAEIAAALEPDNTPEMRMTVTDDEIEMIIERETTGGLQSTVDDYVVNLTVAAQLTNNPKTESNNE